MSQNRNKIALSLIGIFTLLIVGGLYFTNQPQQKGEVLGVNETKTELTNEVTIQESSQAVQSQNPASAQVDIQNPPATQLEQSQTQNQAPVRRIRVDQPAPQPIPQPQSAPIANPDKAPDMESASDLGSSDSDNETFNQTPTFFGSCVSGNIVTLLVDGSAVLPTVKCDQGKYTITPGSKISQGFHDVTVTETNVEGKTSAQSPALKVRIIVSSNIGIPD
jgi:hypothetical protein